MGQKRKLEDAGIEPDIDSKFILNLALRDWTVRDLQLQLMDPTIGNLY
jgi:hypothetical protein